MAAPDNELDFEFPTHLRVYKDGRVERLAGTESLPAGADPQTGVTSKDVRDIVPGTEVYVRIYLPKLSNNTQKLPLLVYIHGGAFCLFSPSSAPYHNYLNALVAKSQLVAVSVHYRRASEHPLPTAYEDSWAAVQWVASHRGGDGPEALLNQHADFRRVFLAGDSAGANIVHNLTMRVGNADAGLNLEILGIALVDPFFGGSDPDTLRDRGRLYVEVLSRSGWIGMVEIHEVEGEGHCFHLHDLNNEKAKKRMRRVAGFFNRDMPSPPILGQ
ncbi:putative carboxylesterase 5 [Sesamum alatum]|uniref:Carboxylesterase 5 n=1 Tax=Sesamum alatum TaxID=300844 RepID=A0AAE1YF51_9LAMI|nr:putative carboxylesterase 5 [Sesamum alatum]